MFSNAFCKAKNISKQEGEIDMRQATPVSTPDEDMTNKDTILPANKDISRLIKSVNFFVMPVASKCFFHNLPYFPTFPYHTL